MGIDWAALEKSLLQLAVKEIRSFAEAHRDVVFSRFGFDCVSDYGDVFLCLDSDRDPKGQAELDRENYPNLYANATLEEIQERFRWEPGGWEFPSFNSEVFDEKWARYQELIHDAYLDESEDEAPAPTPTQARFMQSVCRVLLRLEAENGFEPLRRTSDFRTYVVDHDEGETESRARLESVRRDAQEARAGG